MPLRDDLLQPFAVENPSGKNLKYDRVYDQIKEARAEEDSTLPSGAWERQAKRADTKLVIKLAGDAIATKSKDLQLASWLGEAHIKQEGAPLVQPVLTLLLDLQKDFWPTIYPEIDEGDVSLRAVPLQWAANRYAALVYDLPLTRSGINFHVYKSARALGYEADAANNEAKTKARQDALKRGNLTAEDVDTGIAGTPKAFYAVLDTALQGGREVLEDLALYCEEQYGDDGPTFRKLRDSLDEVHNLVNSLLSDKRAIEPDIIEAPEPEPVLIPEPVVATPVQAAVAMPVAAAPVSNAVVTPTLVAIPAATASATPQSWDDACARVQACAAYMHTQRPGSSVPYLLHTSIRWGELRKHGPKPPLEILVAPPSEIRSGMKMAFTEKAWGDLLGRGMSALNDPSARAWLDLHRYLWVAAKESGYNPFATMIVNAVTSILNDYPEMPQWTFVDDTQVANADTLHWIEETISPAAYPFAAEVASPLPTAPVAAPAPIPIQVAVPEVVANGEEDAFVQAASLAAAGQLAAATALLARDASQQASGRMKYNRRMQIAELCLASGNSGVALPILRELIAEMEHRNLESWETGDMITKPISLLLRSQNGAMDPGDREALFTRLCRVDPAVALSLTL